MVVVSFADAVVGYGSAVADATTSTQIDVTAKWFGIGTKFDTFRIKQNIQRIYALGKRTADSLVELKYEGAWGIETNLVDVTPLTDYIGTDGLGSGNTEILVWLDKGNQASALVSLRSPYVQKVEVSARAEEMVKLKMEGFYRRAALALSTGTTVSWNGETSLASIPSEVGPPITFAGSKVILGTLSDGTTTITWGDVVKEFTVTINTGIDPIYVLNSRYFADVFLGKMEAEGRMTLVITGADASFSGTTLSAMGIKETLDLIDSIELSIGGHSITLNDLKIEELGYRIEPGEVITADIAFYAKTVSIA